MVYACDNCGAWFDADDLHEAMNSGESFIRCKYCGNYMQISEARTSNMSEGYRSLDAADFPEAIRRFQAAVETAKEKNVKAAAEVFIGLALANFHVQTILGEEDNAIPKIIIHEINNNYFEDDERYIQALANTDPSMYPNEYRKFQTYAKTIDSIKDQYKKIEESNVGKYDAFIAFEDNPIDNESLVGYNTAGKVYNKLYDYFKAPKLFMPELKSEGYGFEDYYAEAQILYAINNSKSMVVIADNSIDNRLSSVYTRFFKKFGNKIAFVRVGNNNQITLPNGSYSENVYSETDALSDFSDNSFISYMAQYMSFVVPSFVQEPKPNEAEKKVKIEEPEINDIGQNEVQFGLYPQREEIDSRVVDYFNSLEKPRINNPDFKNWKPLYGNNGRTTAWYIDDYVNGKKYRAVYYYNLRSFYTFQDSGLDNPQRRTKYRNTKTVFCFEFQPILWSVIKTSDNRSTLISRVGLECKEYNSCDDKFVEWKDSSLRDWLNTEFLETAFTDEEKDLLFRFMQYNDDTVTIPSIIGEKKFYEGDGGIIGVSDYFKCIGGCLSAGGGVNEYWIIDNGNEFENEAKVVRPSEKSVANQFVDCSASAVVPLIVVNIGNLKK